MVPQQLGRSVTPSASSAPFPCPSVLDDPRTPGSHALSTRDTSRFATPLPCSSSTAKRTLRSWVLGSPHPGHEPVSSGSVSEEEHAITMGNKNKNRMRLLSPIDSPKSTNETVFDENTLDDSLLWNEVMQDPKTQVFDSGPDQVRIRRVERMPRFAKQ